MNKRRFRWGALAFAALALAACNDHEDATPPAGVSHLPLPPMPTWSNPLIGKRLADFPTTTRCLGAFDVVKVRHTDAAPGVEVEGWAWLQDEKKAPAHILFVDQGGSVDGAGETSIDRPDVPKAVAEVTTSRVGWHGLVSATSGKIRAFAALSDGELCQIGSKDISE